MKHFPTPRTYLRFSKEPDPVMSDEDWEYYVLKRAEEEQDFINATAHLQEKFHGYS